MLAIGAVPSYLYAMQKTQIESNPTAKILRKVRIEAELSVRGLANLIGISHTHLLRIESGERALTPEISKRHAQAIANLARGKSA